MSGHVGSWAPLGMPRLLRKFAFGCKILGKVLKACCLENVDGDCRKRNYISRLNIVIHWLCFPEIVMSKWKLFSVYALCLLNLDLSEK